MFSSFFYEGHIIESSGSGWRAFKASPKSTKYSFSKEGTEPVIEKAFERFPETAESQKRDASDEFAKWLRSEGVAN